MSEIRRCDHCKFFVEIGDKGGYQVGTCHRFPPFPVHHDQAFFPQVISTDWCGEFQPIPEQAGGGERS